MAGDGDRAANEREAALDQREIDAEVRDGVAQAVAAEQEAEDRCLIERHIVTELRESYADEREIALYELERRVKEREAGANLRDLELGEREKWLADQERAADQREVEQAQQNCSPDCDR